MKIIVIGAAGAIGEAVCAELGPRHELIRVGRTSGDIRADMADRASVEAMYREAGPVDAVVSAAGDAHFARFAEHTEDTLMLGLRQKLMGQVLLVLAGAEWVAEGGSFTLTSGILDRDPILAGIGPAIANGALAGFVRAAAIDMPKRQRVNVVSPGLLEVSAPHYGAWFAGHETVSSARVGRAYAKCIEGAGTGQVVPVD